MPGSALPIYDWTSRWALEAELKVWREETTGSTNAIAKDDKSIATIPALENKQKISEPSLYLTKVQTQGRGRGSNSWTSPQGGALLSTWSFAVERVPQPILSPLVGLALFESCREIWPQLPLSVKAPNDLYIKDKKVAGLLIETIDYGDHKRTVIGLGFNVGLDPHDVPTAGSLCQSLEKLGGKPANEAQWRALLDAWLLKLNDAVKSSQNENLSNDQRQRLKAALNLYPLLSSSILEVDEKGQLLTKDGLVRWQDL